MTYHGFALDVCTDLNHYRLINPCGMPEVAVTTIAREAKRDVTVEEVKPLIRTAFEEVFGIKFEDIDRQAPPPHQETAIAKGA